MFNQNPCRVNVSTRCYKITLINELYFVSVFFREGS